MPMDTFVVNHLTLKTGGLLLFRSGIVLQVQEPGAGWLIAHCEAFSGYPH